MQSSRASTHRREQQDVHASCEGYKDEASSPEVIFQVCDQLLEQRYVLHAQSCELPELLQRTHTPAQAAPAAGWQR